MNVQSDIYLKWKSKRPYFSKCVSTMDANVGQDNDDEMDSLDSDYDDYDDKNLRIDDWMFSLWLMYYCYLM